MAKKYDDEDGVWRTIGGRRVFIKKGQDLATAMKESGKFKSAKKDTAKKEITEEEKAKKVEKETKNDPYDDPESEESQRLQYIQSKYDEYLQATEGRGASYGELAHIESLRGKELDDFEKELDNFEESDLDKVKRIQGDLDKKGDKLTKEEKAWKEQLANTQKELESGKSREDIIKDLDREALRNTEKEYGELSKKMQADDYYYKPEDDRKLKELRAKADSERARQGIDTQEKYDKLMNEDSSKKENEEFKPELGKKLSSRSGQESISKDTKVMRYGDDYVVLKNGANKGEFKSQSSAENFAQVIASNEKFEVSELKNKAQGILPSGDIDTHEGDLYIKKTKTSEALINNMKNANSGLLSTFRDQETGETWYDIPFANMGDDYKEKYKHAFPFHEKTEKEKKYAEEVAEYYKDKDIKQEIAKAKKEAEKSTNDIMNEKIRSRGKSKVEEDDLPKHTEIKTQGTSNRKEVSENIQAHILEHYESPQDFIEQMDVMRAPTKWHAGEQLAKGGSYLIYYDDQREFLDNLKINPKGKKFSDDRVFQTYSSLIGRESAKLYDRIQKNSYKKYMKAHPLSKMSFEEFKDMNKK